MYFCFSGPDGPMMTQQWMTRKTQEHLFKTRSTFENFDWKSQCFICGEKCSRHRDNTSRGFSRSWSLGPNKKNVCFGKRLKKNQLGQVFFFWSLRWLTCFCNGNIRKKNIVPKYARPRNWTIFRFLLNSQMRIIKFVIRNTLPYLIFTRRYHILQTNCKCTVCFNLFSREKRAQIIPYMNNVTSNAWKACVH